MCISFFTKERKNDSVEKDRRKLNRISIKGLEAIIANELKRSGNHYGLEWTDLNDQSKANICHLPITSYLHKVEMINSMTTAQLFKYSQMCINGKYIIGIFVCRIKVNFFRLINYLDANKKLKITDDMKIASDIFP